MGLCWGCLLKEIIPSKVMDLEADGFRIENGFLIEAGRSRSRSICDRKRWI